MDGYDVYKLKFLSYFLDCYEQYLLNKLIF